MNVADAPSTVSPAPSAAALSAAPDAIVMFLSSTSSVVLLSVVVVPFTVRFPPIVTAPVVVRVAKLVMSSPVKAEAISAPVWSAVALASMPDSFVFSASVKALVSLLFS